MITETHEQSLAAIIKTQGRVIKFYEKRVQDLTRLVNEQAHLIAWMDDKHEGFYQSQEWIELRQQVLDTYGEKCMRCGAMPRDGAIIQVDHIKSKLLFPSLALVFENMQVLCRQCNLGKGYKDMTDYRPKGATQCQPIQANATHVGRPLESILGTTRQLSKAIASTAKKESRSTSTCKSRRRKATHD